MDKLAQVDIGKEFGSSLGRSAGIGDIVSITISAALAIAGVIFLFLLAGGGLAMIAGAGSNNPEKVQQGKQAATYAIIGFIIVFAAFWIVRLLEELIGVRFITVPGF